MTHPLASRAAALTLASFVTLILAGGLDHLANTPPTADALARSGQPLQVVVVTAKRLPQS